MTVPTGPPPRPPSAPPQSAPSRTGRTLVIGAVVVLALVAGALGAVLLLGEDEASAEEVFLEPISTAGENPFMPELGEDEPDVEPPTAESGEAADVGGQFNGDTPGLYGGTRDQATCDADQMVAFLEANPAQAEAWAGVLGITTSQIDSFVAGLTPVVLRSDTAVTNHGFRDGQATTIPAVLQAGTAVLVDEFGRPVVKCFCGNPLTAPEPRADVVYTGPRWTSFRQTNITIVQQTTVVINTYTLIDIDTGEPFGRPAGTDGSEDGEAPDSSEDPPGTTTITTPTTTTTEPEGLPGSATYSGVVSANCAGQITEGPISAALDNGTITITGEGGSASGQVGADGRFSVSAEGTTVSGVVNEFEIVGTVSAGGCTGSVTAQRTD